MSPDVGSPPSSRWAKIGSLLLPRLVFYPFVVASLLVFPAWLPWMILGWLLLYALQRSRGKPAWKTLDFCLVILLVRGLDWTPALIALGLLMLASSVFELKALQKPATIAAACLLPAWIAMAWSWSAAVHTSRTPALASERPILCMGDSLSANGYPRVLQTLLSVPVVDKAQGGTQTTDGLRALPEVLALKPQAVVLELGGNDYVMGKSREATRANLETMIRAIRESGAEVFLFEVPRGFVYDSYWGLDRRLARGHDLELINDGAIRQLVLFGPGSPLTSCSGRLLSYDGLHPNDAGHVLLAGRVAAALRRVYGDGILRRPAGELR
ncbi:MAG: hypothetical protein HY293_09330 [Planctomycetes bacterium]|nr:hypothetical protein [Planctomycetota bacterium]